MQMFTSPLASSQGWRHGNASANRSSRDRRKPINSQSQEHDQVPPPSPKKKLVRRTDRDYSQLARRSFQAAFLLLNLWLGSIFYFWVRQFEPGGAPTSLHRPAGVEGWLPIAGLMNLRYFLLTHHVPALHPAGMFLLIAFLAMSFLFRKAFCSWLCPVGTISEYLWRAGQKLFRRNFHLPRWLDIGLRGLKYLLLGFFVWAVTSMAVDELAAFMSSPYGVIADVKMLNFFRHLGETGAIVARRAGGRLAVHPEFLVPLSLPLRRAAGDRGARQPDAHPPQLRHLHRLRQMRQGLPLGAAGRQADHHQVRGMHRLPGVRRRLPGQRHAEPSLPRKTSRPRAASAARFRLWAMAAGIAVLFFGIVGFAKTSGYWDSHVPRAIYQQLVPHADEARHPMPGAGN